VKFRLTAKWGKLNFTFAEQKLHQKSGINVIFEQDSKVRFTAV
jgi:hypothetical protein